MTKNKHFPNSGNKSLIRPAFSPHPTRRAGPLNGRDLGQTTLHIKGIIHRVVTDRPNKILSPTMSECETPKRRDIRDPQTRSQSNETMEVTSKERRCGREY